MPVSPTKIDPTRTGALRRRLSIEMRKRINTVRKAVNALVLEQDAFDLASSDGSLESLIARSERQMQNPTAASVASQWRFLQDTDKLTAFKRWLNDQINTVMLGDDDKAVYTSIIAEAFQRGALRAYDDVQSRRRKSKTTKRIQPIDVISGSADFQNGYARGERAAFLRQLLPSRMTVNLSTAESALQLLSTLTLSNLEGISAAMSTQIVSLLTAGLVAGQSPYDIAKAIAKATGITIERAERIARTEIIRAYAEGQLNSLTELGVDEVGVEVEFTITKDGRACKTCSALSGVVFKIDEASGIIPVHPSCRCAWIPHLPASLSEPVRSSAAVSR